MSSMRFMAEDEQRRILAGFSRALDSMPLDAFAPDDGDGGGDGVRYDDNDYDGVHGDNGDYAHDGGNGGNGDYDDDVNCDGGNAWAGVPGLDRSRRVAGGGNEYVPDAADGGHAQPGGRRSPDSDDSDDVKMKNLARAQ
jgi:hypothetical protein